MSTTDEHTTLAQEPAAEISAEVLATLTEIGEEVNASLDLDEVLARTAAKYVEAFERLTGEKLQ